MFSPRYTITPKILSNIKRIAELTFELNQKALPKVVLFELERNARAVSAHTSTSIEGNPLPLTEVKRILKNHPHHVRDSEREVLNYNKALEDLDALIKQGRAALNIPLILRIQKTVLSKLASPFWQGKLRQEAVFVNDFRTRKTVYWPPDHSDVSPLLKDLLLFTSQNDSKIDPLILAGIFHRQLVIIHPFMDGNGRTCRLATKALLAQMGINTFNLFSFERYYNQNVSKYFEKVGVIGDYYGIRDSIDFTEWLGYFTDGIIDELFRVKKEIEKISLKPSSELREYHQKILAYIKEHGYISDSTYATLTKRAKATRALDFKKLIGLGMIRRHGKGKATYYTLE